MTSVSHSFDRRGQRTVVVVVVVVAAPFPSGTLWRSPITCNFTLTNTFHSMRGLRGCPFCSFVVVVVVCVFVVVVFVFYPATWASTRRLLKIHSHFGRVDSVMQRAYPHIIIERLTIFYVSLVLLSVSVCCATALCHISKHGA